MTDTAPTRLAGEEVLALKFAANRQLTRWAKKPRLSPDHHAQRNALKRAVAVLREPAFAHGCELRSPGSREGGS
jgi:uncharacterized membrane protein YccC